MSMRERYDKNGNLTGCHNMVFDDISDDYEVQKVILNDLGNDLSYIEVMKHLRNQKVGEEFLDKKFYADQVLNHMGSDYLYSAIFLHQRIIQDRGQDIVSYYLVPCAFLCKHSIELKLKQCLLRKGKSEVNGHSVLKLWIDLDEKVPQSDALYSFLAEVEKIDSNEMALRYGVSKKLSPLQEDFKFDIDSLIANTKFLFNIVDEYILSVYRN